MGFTTHFDPNESDTLCRIHTGAKINFLFRNYQEFDVLENVNFVKNETLKL